MKQIGMAVESWGWERKLKVVRWLRENFGTEGERWGVQYDYGLDNLYMDEDIYMMYLLKWV